MAAGFALFTVVETSLFFGCNVNTFFNSTCWTIHFSNSLFYYVVHTQFFLSIFGYLKWDIKNNCLSGTKFIFFYQRNRVFCLFLSSLRSLVTINELCEQTTRLNIFQNHKCILELLHNRQEILISLCWNNTCQNNRHLHKHIKMILDSLQKCKSPWPNDKKKDFV